MEKLVQDYSLCEGVGRLSPEGGPIVGELENWHVQNAYHTSDPVLVISYLLSIFLHTNTWEIILLLLLSPREVKQFVQDHLVNSRKSQDSESDLKNLWSSPHPPHSQSFCIDLETTAGEDGAPHLGITSFIHGFQNVGDWPLSTFICRLAKNANSWSSSQTTCSWNSRRWSQPSNCIRSWLEPTIKSLRSACHIKSIGLRKASQNPIGSSDSEKWLLPSHLPIVFFLKF